MSASQYAKSLALVNDAARAVAVVETPAEAKDLYDRLETLSQYAKRYRLDHAQQNEIAEAKLRTARKGGQLLASVTSPNASREGRRQLPEGMTWNQSSRWQSLASLDDDTFEAHLSAVRERDEELTLASALRAARLNVRAADVIQLRERTVEQPTFGDYATVVADPPWQYDNKATRGAAEDHYPTMSIDELCELPVSEWATEQAHLYLWTTNGFLREAFDVLDAWGFKYKTTLVWVKPQIGLGNYFRSSTEYVLFGVRGGLRTLDSNQRNWFEAKRGRHSKKPAFFFDLVERVSPGPFLEMFARERRLSEFQWGYWGNEA